MQDVPGFVHTRIMEAVRRFVAEAIARGSVISATACAAEIKKAYPACFLSEKALAEEVAAAAARAGVPVLVGEERREPADAEPSHRTAA